MNRATLFLTIFLIAGAGLHAADYSQPATGSEFTMTVGSSAVEWLPTRPELGYELRVQSPDGSVSTRTFAPGEVPTWRTGPDAKKSVNGLYTYEIVPISETEVERSGNIAPPLASLSNSTGYFTVRNGTVVRPDVQERTLAKDFVNNDDTIVQGSLCVGFDCVNNENFGFDTIRLKENNLRIKFEDTSVSGSFPSNDWQITANDSNNGGANYLAIEDVTGGKVPFRVLAGAPSNSLYVASSGRVGLGTATPALRFQVSYGDTPGMRLEQTNAFGWTAQTWDVSGNEANFFVRDATNGSKLPFRIRPGAPTSSLDIQASGDIGVGTDSPTAPLHVRRTGGTAAAIVAETTGGSAAPRRMMLLSNNGDPVLRLQNSSNNVDWDFRTSNSGFSITKVGSGQLEAEVRNNGDFAIAGSYLTSSSRSLKQDIVPVDGSTVLAKLDTLPVAEWQYIHDPAERHVGPMAEDFYAAFGLGPDNKHVVAADMAGVALAATKALKAENEALKKRLDAMQAELDALRTAR